MTDEHPVRGLLRTIGRPVPWFAFMLLPPLSIAGSIELIPAWPVWILVAVSSLALLGKLLDQGRAAELD